MALVEFELDCHVTVVTSNRPEARNGINTKVGVRLARVDGLTVRSYGTGHWE